MTIDPRDLRTLLVRVTLVTLAVRVAPMLGTELGPAEVTTALGLGPEAASPEPLAAFWRAWTLLAGHSGFLVRLPSLVFDLSLPLLAVAYARAAGWGALAGLLAGLVLAMAPLGIEAGFRSDGAGLLSALGLGALVLLRQGVQRGSVGRLIASGLLLGLGCHLAPPLAALGLAGLYLGARAVALPAVRGAAAGLWLLGPLAGIGLRLAHGLPLLPVPTRALDWLAQPLLAGDPSGWHAVAPLHAVAEALAALSPAGPVGTLARLFDQPPAELAGLLLAGAVTLWASFGLVRGLVQPDPPPPPKPRPTSPLAATRANHPPSPKSSPDADLEASDLGGWQTLGVASLPVARQVGDRDWLPLVLALGGVLAWVAVAAAGSFADGVGEALATGRPVVALLLGLGLAAAVQARELGTPQGDPGKGRRRSHLTLGLAALTVFGLGAWHLLEAVRTPDRKAPAKVARFVHESTGAQGAVLALGPRGAAVGFLLDARALAHPDAARARLRLSPLTRGDAVAHLVMLLRRQPLTVVLTGDLDALGETGTTAPPRADLAKLHDALLATLQTNGFAQVEDSHRYLGGTGVVAYSREAPPTTDPRAVRPQLGPGLAP